MYKTPRKAGNVRNAALARLGRNKDSHVLCVNLARPESTRFLRVSWYMWQSNVLRVSGTLGPLEVKCALHEAIDPSLQCFLGQMSPFPPQKLPVDIFSKLL